MSSDDSILIYDTTLRDGTQGLGLSFSSLDKLRVAEKLDEFRKALREKVYGKEAQPKQVDGAKELSRLT